MTKYYASSCPQTRSFNAGQIFNYLLNLFFVAGWWIFFQRNRPHPDNRPDQRMLLRLFAAGSALLRHICGDNRSHFASFADGSAVSALRTRLFVEQVGTGKKLVILLASILLGAAVPYLLLAIEEGFARVAPQTSLIEFAPWADADIMRIVRNRY